MYCVRFTYTENVDYGPYIESINGVSGDQIKQTYWELLVKMVNGTIFTANLGEQDCSSLSILSL